MFKQFLSLLFEKNSESHQVPAEKMDYWFCVGTCCVPTMWLVQRTDDTWRIQESRQGPAAWRVLSEKPVCPRCGGHLQATVASLPKFR